MRYNLQGPRQLAEVGAFLIFAMTYLPYNEGKL